MKRRKLLSDFEDNWTTRMGAWFPGERVVFKGKDLFSEMFRLPWMTVWHHSVIDRLLTKNEDEFWSRLWVLATSYPEPRIWNNRVAALTGTARSTAYLAMSAGTAASEATYFGGQAIIAASEFITTTQRRVQDGESLGEIVINHVEINGVPAGFGRPVIRSDERIPPAKKLAHELGLDNGQHFDLAFKVEAQLKNIGLKCALNIGGLAAALAADQRMSPREFYCTSSVVYLAGLMACYFDSSQKPSGSFLPLRSDRIDYRGQPPRKWEKPKILLD